MSDIAKALPKSLHTITAIVRVALHLLKCSPAITSTEMAISEALRVLGYAGSPDPHGLAAKALSALIREA